MMKTVLGRSVSFPFFRIAALVLAVCLLPVMSLAEDADSADSDWVDFMLICNEGMNNDKGNAGNTMMLVALNQRTGRINLLTFTWDTFIDYEGYDEPQRLDMPYRNNGATELVNVFNANFGTNIRHYLSLNYLNLAFLIDAFGGIEVDITRAERNALNGMVGSKRNQLQDMVSRGLLTQMALESLAQEYYLDDYGPNTHLNGLQAVGFGWLQYDSVYNCCEREIEVVGALFHSLGMSIAERAVFYTDGTERPEVEDSRRVINLDSMDEEDQVFLSQVLSPIFAMSYHNLTDEEISAITWSLARAGYLAARQGVRVFDRLGKLVLPLEAKNAYEIVAGAKGHLVDKEANAAAIQAFLHGEE